MELFGLSAHVREVCDRLATGEFVALAANLYQRTVSGVELAEEPEAAMGGDRPVQPATQSRSN